MHLILPDSYAVTLLDTIYVVWSVSHIWVRVVAICVVGSRVNEWAHKVIDLQRSCPFEFVSTDVCSTDYSFLLQGDIYLKVRFLHRFKGWSILDTGMRLPGRDWTVSMWPADGDYWCLVNLPGHYFTSFKPGKVWRCAARNKTCNQEDTHSNST